MQSPRPVGATSQIVKVGDGTTPMSHKGMSNADTGTSSSVTNAHNIIKFPMQVSEALKVFNNYLTEYEKKEILDFPTIYYFNH